MDYSFIIPHKNNPELLRKCINSIPHFDGVEIIVVDDNSSSEFVDFDNFPGAEDPYVRLIFTIEGRGAGYARNIGVKESQGKWLIFADADDYFTSSLEGKMREFCADDHDVVFFKASSVKLLDGSPSWRNLEFNRRVDIALSKGDYTLPLLFSSPWAKFFKRDFVVQNQIFFNEVRWGNDVVFMGRIAVSARNCIADGATVYCITESDGSLIKTTTLESALVRFKQECENVCILRNSRFVEEPSIYYWLLYTWLEVWKIRKCRAFICLPRACYSGRIAFVKELFRVKRGK